MRISALCSCKALRKIGEEFVIYANNHPHNDIGKVDMFEDLIFSVRRPQVLPDVQSS